MWRVRGFSIQGYAHLTEGTPCQDAYRQATVGTSALLAVADGAGSRPRSAEGAAILVSVTIDVLTAMVKAPGDPADAHQLKARLGQAYQWIRDQFIKQVTALAGQGQAGEFAATLIAAVVTDGLLGIIQVGDGFAVSRTRNQHGTTHLHLLTQKGIYIIENANLEELARDRCYSFAFIGVPLKFQGATASPLRPLALV